MIKVGINGFGRIGSLAMRAMQEDENIKVVAINEPAGDGYQIARALKFNTAQGIFNHNVESLENRILIEGEPTEVTGYTHPRDIPWGNLGVDVVFESSGRLRTKEGTNGGYNDHLEAGAKYVLLSAPAKDNVPTVVYGVNYDPSVWLRSRVVSNASCTTNCAAAVLYVLENQCGINDCEMITIHSYTADQNLTDGYHTDPRRSRAAAQNIIPTTTGAAKAVADVVPDLHKLAITATAYRVPVMAGSLIHFNVELDEDDRMEGYERDFMYYAKNDLRGILQYSKEPLVSSDIIGNQHSAIIDGTLTQKLPQGRTRFVAWYDNEWGYSNRAADIISNLGYTMQSGR